MAKLGHTNRMATYILGVLTLFILLSFYLAVQSIKYQYTGALACWTACVSPLGVSLSIVVNSTVKKSQAENTGASGEGIRFHQIVNNEEEPTI